MTRVYYVFINSIIDPIKNRNNTLSLTVSDGPAESKILTLSRPGPLAAGKSHFYFNELSIYDVTLDDCHKDVQETQDAQLYQLPSKMAGTRSLEVDFIHYQH